MKNYLVISLLILSFGFPQKMLNKKDMIEEKLPDSDEIIVYPPNSENQHLIHCSLFGELKSVSVAEPL